MIIIEFVDKEPSDRIGVSPYYILMSWSFDNIFCIGNSRVWAGQ